MTALEMLQQARLGEAISELQNALRDKPSDVANRAFYIQLLIAAGEWEKALKQLQTLGSIDPTKAVEIQIAVQNIDCERVRQSVFADGRDPMIFGEPSQWIADLVLANKACAAGKWSDAVSLREKAFEGAPGVGGSIGGQAFQWLADTDERLGPVFEVYLQGAYYWMPIERIRKIEINEPTHLQDSVWISATITTSAGGIVAGMLPVRYPGEPGPDDAHRLSRATSFEVLGADDPSGGVNVGHGQRVWVTDIGEHAILETREILFDVSEDALQASE